jgi:hypothetical protein
MEQMRFVLSFTQSTHFALYLQGITLLAAGNGIAGISLTEGWGTVASRFSIQRRCSSFAVEPTTAQEVRGRHQE